VPILLVRFFVSFNTYFSVFFFRGKRIFNKDNFV